MSDLISRQAAIELFKDDIVAVNELNNLPSLPDRMKYVQESVNIIMNTCKSDSIKDKAFRNAARMIQNAIDGEAPDFETIEELPSAQPVNIAKLQPNCNQVASDCISRQAMINAFLTELTKRERKNLLHTWSTVEVKYFVADMLEKLPSAQPDVPDTNVGDMISRQAAIENSFEVYTKEYGWCEVVGVDAINSLPSVTPKQPGWIPWDSGGFPEESGTYTVTAYDGATKRVTYAKYQKRLKRWELTGSRAYWKVLAWQPLPTPYREGEQE